MGREILNSETSQIVQVLKNLFNGNPSCYGLETSSGLICVREPITDQVLIDHIEGRKRVGVYPLVGNEINFGVVDFDETPWEQIGKFIAACIDKKLYPYLERSKRRELGLHCFLFFDEPIQAKGFRRVMASIIKEVGLDPKLEVFPKQDEVSGDGMGNFIFLPLHGESVKQDRTILLDFNFNPYPDQLKALRSIYRTKSENILSLAQEIPEQPKPEHQKSESPADGNLDVSKYLIHYNIPFKLKQDEARTFFLLNRCLFADNHTTKDNEGDSSIVQDSSGKLTYQCFHGHCKQRTWADARRKISGDEPLTQFLKGYTENKAGKARNLAEGLREWIEMSYGNFTTSQLYNDLDIRTTTDKTFIRVNLHRLVEKRTIERGLSNGTFRKIDRETNLIAIEDTVSKPIPLKWPGDLEGYVKIMRKTTVGVAGTMQAGKTAYLLNVAWLNKDLMPTYYFTSEFGGDELRERLQPFGFSMEKWRTITFIERSRDFQDVINPDGLNLIDYLEVSDDGEYYKMGIQIKRIYEKLNQGVAVIGLQKKFGSDFGYGGQPTADKPRLYITLEKSTLKIVKAKLWTGEINPNGMSRKFKLHKGARFTWDPWDFYKA